MIVVDVEQGTEEWFAIRAGVLTASNFSKILTSTGKPSSQWKTYLLQVAGERITGKPEEGYSNFWMERGKEMEAEARKYYEFVAETEVKQVGFVFKDKSRRIGCSPDGLVGEGGLEIKCVKMSTQVKYLLYNKLPSEYVAQVQGSLYVTGLKWWDFLSYYPGLDPLLIRVYPDPAYQKKLQQYLQDGIKEIDEIIKKIRRRK